METRAQEIKAKGNPRIKIQVIPGHFATNHSHINYYIDLTRPMTRHRDAHLVACELAQHYLGTPIDTIICMDDTQVIAAFLAEELSTKTSSVNNDNNIGVLVPEFNSNGQMIFRDNVQKYVWQKNVLLLIASATTGKTIKRSLECLNYYNGKIAGIAALFSATNATDSGIPIKSVFTPDDFPQYNTYPSQECPACKSGQKIDAIVNSHGYSKI